MSNRRYLYSLVVTTLLALAIASEWGSAALTKQRLDLPTSPPWEAVMGWPEGILLRLPAPWALPGPQPTFDTRDNEPDVAGAAAHLRTLIHLVARDSSRARAAQAEVNGILADLFTRTPGFQGQLERYIAAHGGLQ